MWNMIHTQGGQPYDKKIGDRYEVDKSRHFEPVVIEVTIFDSKVSTKTKAPRAASIRDTLICNNILGLLNEHFTPKKPDDSKPKQLDDGKTIEI